MATNNYIPQERIEDLFKILKMRFEKNQNRHKGLEWAKVQAKLEGYLSGKSAKSKKYGRSMKWRKQVESRTW